MMRAFALLLILSLPRSARAEASVPSPTQVALEELHRMQLREPELWHERDKYCVGCGAAAIAAGIPVAASMLPLGAVLIAFSHQNYDPAYDVRFSEARYARRSIAIGTTLLLAGAVGVAAVVWGCRKVIRERRPRAAAMRELRTNEERRTLLERMLESYLSSR